MERSVSCRQPKRRRRDWCRCGSRTSFLKREAALIAEVTPGPAHREYLSVRNPESRQRSRADRPGITKKPRLQKRWRINRDATQGRPHLRMLLSYLAQQALAPIETQQLKNQLAHSDRTKRPRSALARRQLLKSCAHRRRRSAPRRRSP